MSAAAASTIARGHGRKAQQRRLMMVAGAVALLVVFYALAKSKSAKATPAASVDPTAPYYDPASGEWIDPNTGMPVNSMVNSSANDAGGPVDSSAPVPVTLVDSFGAPVTFPTGGSDNGNGGTGSSDAPPPGTGGSSGGGGGSGSSSSPSSPTQPAPPPSTQPPSTQPPAPAPPAVTSTTNYNVPRGTWNRLPSDDQAAIKAGFLDQPVPAIGGYTPPPTETQFSTPTAPPPHAAAVAPAQPVAPTTPAPSTPAPAPTYAAEPPPPPVSLRGPLAAF